MEAGNNNGHMAPGLIAQLKAEISSCNENDLIDFLRKMPAEAKRNEEVMMHALKVAKMKGIKPREVVSTVANDMGNLLESPQFIKEVCKLDPACFGFASNKLRKNIDFIKDLCSVQWLCFRYAHEDARGDKKLVRDLCSVKKLFLLDAATELRRDKDFITELVIRDKHCLVCADDTLRSDPKFIDHLISVTGDIQPFIYAKEVARSDKELVKRLLLKYPEHSEIVIHVGSELREDPETMVHILKINPEFACQVAAENLKQNPALIICFLAVFGLEIKPILESHGYSPGAIGAAMDSIRQHQAETSVDRWSTQTGMPKLDYQDKYGTKRIVPYNITKTIKSFTGYFQQAYEYLKQVGMGEVMERFRKPLPDAPKVNSGAIPAEHTPVNLDTFQALEESKNQAKINQTQNR